MTAFVRLAIQTPLVRAAVDRCNYTVVEDAKKILITRKQNDVNLSSVPDENALNSSLQCIPSLLTVYM